MLPLQILFCFILISGIDNVPIEDSKPVELAYSCLKITLNENKDDRAPILVVHGFTGFKEMYLGLSQVLAFKTARRVCLVDLRNHGNSPWSDVTDSKTMAADLNLLMKTLNVEKLVLLGHSMGGKVAVEFALSYPEKVEKLIVEDMRPNGMSEEALKLVAGDASGLSTLRNVLKLIPEGASEKEAKNVIGQFFKRSLEALNDTVDFDDKWFDYVPIRCRDGKCEWKSNIDVLERVKRDPLKYWTKSSGQSKKPALFIYGEKSVFKVGNVEEEIKKLFPNAKLHEVKGGSHVLNGYPDYRDAVIHFINAQN